MPPFEVPERYPRRHGSRPASAGTEPHAAVAARLAGKPTAIARALRRHARRVSSDFRSGYIDGAARRSPEGGDPQGVRDGARGDQRRSCPRRSAARPTSPARTTRMTKGSTAASPRDDYAGRYVYYGIREFGMAAAMNGHGAAWRRDPLWRHLPGLLRLCRGRRSGWRRCSRRASIYVMTHDPIGLGEDGPTHQPIEHVMRAAR